MTPFRIAFVLSITIHLAILLFVRNMYLNEMSSKDQNNSQGVLNITLSSGETVVDALDINSLLSELHTAETDKTAMTALIKSTLGEAQHSNQPNDTAKPEQSSTPTTKSISTGDEGPIQSDATGVHAPQVEIKAESKNTHPRNWIAFMVKISKDGVITEYSQVSKEDVNGVLNMMLIEQIKAMKIPENLFGNTILVSGPPLKIETDPKLIAEYL